MNCKTCKFGPDFDENGIGKCKATDDGLIDIEIQAIGGKFFVLIEGEMHAANACRQYTKI